MGKRSPRYDPSRHGTGWDNPDDMPNEAAINFIEQDMVSPENKVEYIVSMGGTPPDTLPAPTVTEEEEEEEDEEPVGFITTQGRTTTHFMINWAGTGFEYRLQRRLSDSLQIEAIRAAWVESQQIGS